MKQFWISIKMQGSSPSDFAGSRSTDCQVPGRDLLELPAVYPFGEEFIRRYLGSVGIKVLNSGRTSATDLQISERRFEVKRVSLGVNGTFQFNHVRLDCRYNYLLCLGISPHQIVFNIWRKGEVAEEGAGRLVRMAEGQSVTYKITKNWRICSPSTGYRSCFG